MGRGEKHSGEELVVLRQVTTRVEADLIEALLKGAGIPCIVHPPPVHDIHLLWQTAPGVITIRIRAKHLERAEDTIAEREESSGADEPGTAGERG